jgi:hypothetical protein
MIPIFIISRDRLNPLSLLLNRLKGQDITIIDNASTYEPLLDFYKACNDCKIIRLKENHGYLAPWTQDLIPKNTPYIVTDPDVIPVDHCPEDFIEFLYDVLLHHRDKLKIGLGLKIDDIPDSYKFKNEVLVWEGQFWHNPIGIFMGVQLYQAPLDTTFAIYKPNTTHALTPSLRTGEPYVARHTPWYSNSDHPTEEEIYYKEHAHKAITSWMHDDISPVLKEIFKK